MSLPDWLLEKVQEWADNMGYDSEEFMPDFEDLLGLFEANGYTLRRVTGAIPQVMVLDEAAHSLELREARVEAYAQGFADARFVDADNSEIRSRAERWVDNQ